MIQCTTFTVLNSVKILPSRGAGVVQDGEFHIELTYLTGRYPNLTRNLSVLPYMS